jgi:FixJ family two-component response regulator
MSGAPLVFVVDDDPSVRSSLKFLISTVVYTSRLLTPLKLLYKDYPRMIPVALCWTSDCVD